MIKYFNQGGFMMVPLLLCSVVAVAVIIERMIYFSHLSSVYKKISRSLLSSFEKKDIDRVYSMCRSYSIPLTRILLEGIAKIKQGKDAVDSAMEESALDQVSLIEKRLPVLSTIASIATLLGFTGTVIGMIMAFESIAREGISSPTIVASGISAALITTATGLIIAIPAIVFYQYFSHRVDWEIKIIQKYSKELLTIFD